MDNWNDREIAGPLQECLNQNNRLDSSINRYDYQNEYTPAFNSKIHYV